MSGRTRAPEEPVRIDYTTSVPERVVGHCCYDGKCVWITHPLRIELFSVKLMYRELLSVDVFRRFIDIPRSQKTREGQKFMMKLYRAATRYAILRSIGASHGDAIQDVLTLLPDKLRGDARAYQYFERTLRMLVEHAGSIVEANIQKAPETGWRILCDETFTVEPLFFPATYMLRVLSYSMSLPRVYTELVFCDERRCYPVPNGIWPTSRWTVIVGEAARHDVYYYFLENFGATNIVDYLTNLDIDEVAITVRPGYKSSSVVLYVPVRHPEEHVVRVAKMQELADKIMKQLENLIVHGSAGRIIDGLSVLGVSEDDIYDAVKKIIGKK